MGMDGGQANTMKDENLLERELILKREKEEGENSRVDGVIGRSKERMKRREERRTGRKRMEELRNWRRRRIEGIEGRIGMRRRDGGCH